MKTKELTISAMLTMVLYGAYILFSQVLYLEAVTFVTLLIALLFPLKISVLAAFSFGILNILLNGLFPWTIMYLILFPLYMLIGNKLKNKILSSELMMVIVVFLFSFLLGQLVDLPFVLFSGKLTAIYLLLGFKTSLIQGFISAMLANFLFKKAYDRIYRYLRGKNL